jgi:hypothetical protein
MCDVPSIAVFCSESIEWFHGIIIIIIVSYHRPFLPGTSLEPAVIPTAQASSEVPGRKGL